MSAPQYETRKELTHRISPKYPNLKLKIVGYATDQTYFRALAGGDDRIEFCDPVHPPEAAELVAHSRMLVLPSRTEAMGRVLLEAMAEAGQ